MLALILIFLLSGAVSANDFSEALDTTLSFTTGGSANWFSQTTSSDWEWFYPISTSYYGGDDAQSGSISDDQESWMQTTVSGAGTVSFYWKVSSERHFDFLEFYIDGSLQDQISGSVGWHRMMYAITALGSHTLEWRYVKDHSTSEGDDSGRVDKVEWTTGPPSDALSKAMDTTLSFTTGGGADWLSQTTAFYYDEDAAESGDISDDQESWMQTIVSGAGTVSFYWKVSSEGGYDYLEFYIDGVLQGRISGSVDWHQMKYAIPSLGLHTLEWRYVKDGSVSEKDDCGWVDQLEWDGGFPSPPLPDSLSRALDTSLSLTTGGSAGWFSQSTTFRYDEDAAQSGGISDNQESWMQTMVSGAGMVRFYWKVSSESGYDYLEFYIDGVLQGRISGSADWHQMKYAIPALGLHTLEWRYMKDGGVSEGNDCGWVDQLEWDGGFPSPPPPPPPSPPDSLSGALDTSLSLTTGGSADWFYQTAMFYYDGDAAQSGAISDYQESWMQTMVNGTGAVTFYWKVSSEEGYDYLEFYIDNVLQSRISGSTDWNQMDCTIPDLGLHTLKWQYVKDSSVSEGNDCGWVDQVEVWGDWEGGWWNWGEWWIEIQ
jgi:hypothetical protein